MVVLLSLVVYLAGQLLKISHNKRVDNFDVLVVLGGQMVLHQPNFLSQQINFLLVVTHTSLRLLNDVANVHDLRLHVVLIGCSHASG